MREICSKKLSVLAVVLSLLLVSPALALLQCANNQTLRFNAETKALTCVDCPANCLACHDELGTTKCFGCQNGFFSAPDGSCQRCAEGCDYCYGPKVADCINVTPGRFYSQKSDKLEACPTGCSVCDPSFNCNRCMPGYRESPLLDEKRAKKLINGSPLVQCIKCADANCNYCELDEFAQERCTNCNFEFGLDSLSRKCAKCQTGCLSCPGNPQVCSYCKEGFQRNPSTGQCQEITIPNCMSVNEADGKCIWCKTGFVLEPTKETSCINCEETDPLCTTCRVTSASEVVPYNTPNKLICENCPDRFFLDPVTKKCKRCGDKCNYCGSEDKCFLCAQGFGIEKGKCVPSTLEGCDVVTEEGCIGCKNGLYLDEKTKKCNKCHASCVSCSGPNEDDCNGCGADKFTLYKEDKTDKPNTSQQIGADVVICVVRLQNKCFANCPQNDYKEDFFLRQCIKKTEEEKKPKSKYIFSRSSQQTSWETLLQDSFSFLVQYKTYQYEAITIAKEWAEQNKEAAKQFSSICNYRGKVEEKVSLTRETYYRCRCLEGNHGFNCWIDTDMYNTIQAFVTGFIYDMSSLNFNVHEEQLFLIIKNLASTHLNLGSLGSINYFLDTKLSKAYQYKLSRVLSYLETADTMIKAYQGEKSEIMASLDGKTTDISYDGTKNSIYGHFRQIIELSRKVVGASLNKTDSFRNTNTQSFQATFITPTENTFSPNKKEWITIYPGDIYTYSVSDGKIEFVLVNKQMNVAYGYLGLVAWAYNAVLFPKQKRFASFLLSVQVVDHRIQKEFEISSNDSSDELEVIFPLRIVPSNVKVESKLQCATIEFSGTKEPVLTLTPVHAVTESAENKKLVAVCKFKNYRLKDIYYTVSYTGEEVDVIHTNIHRAAMEESSDFPKELPTFIPGYSELLIHKLKIAMIGLAIVYALIL